MLAGLSSITRMRVATVSALLDHQREAAALAGLALALDAPAEQQRELVREVQPEARARVAPPAGSRHLAEGREQLLPVLRRDADAGVLHGQAADQRSIGAALRPFDRHRALVGELDRVAGEIDEDLRQRAAVGAQHRLAVRFNDLESESL